MKKLEKKLTCPICGCADAITPFDKMTLFGWVYYKTRCRQCNCALANLWWFDGIVGIGIILVAAIIFSFMKFLEINMGIFIAHNRFYEWCIALPFVFVYMWIMGLIALYFIPNREGWDGYKKK